MTSSSSRLRVGVIGCGVGRAHLTSYATLPDDVEIVALAGTDEDRCRRLAAEFNIPRLFSDYRDLLAQPDVEAVSVCTPNYLHAPITLAAVAAGKHVLVEKPLAMTVAEGEAMVRAAEKAGRVLMIVFNYRFRGDAQTLKRHIDAGGLGEVYYVQAGWLRRHGIPGHGSWFVCKEQSGGGPLIDLGVHVLDLALWLMGRPRAVAVSAATYAALGPRGRGLWPGLRPSSGGGNFDVEDLALAFIRLETGATLSLAVSWAGYTGWGDDYFVHLWGQEGGAELTVRGYAEADTLRFFADVAGVRTEMRPQCPAVPGHAQVVGEFVRAVKAGRPTSPTGEEGLAVLRLVDAIYRSAAEGKEIRL
jgi:predicted dehydrogenase